MDACYSKSHWRRDRTAIVTDFFRYPHVGACRLYPPDEHADVKLDPLLRHHVDCCRPRNLVGSRSTANSSLCVLLPSPDVSRMLKYIFPGSIFWLAPVIAVYHVSLPSDDRQEIYSGGVHDTTREMRFRDSRRRILSAPCGVSCSSFSLIFFLLTTFRQYQRFLRLELSVASMFSIPSPRFIAKLIASVSLRLLG